MTLLIILLSALVYSAAAFQTTRHLVGHAKYKQWRISRGRSYSSEPEDFSAYDWDDEGFYFFMWALLSFGVLPMAIAIAWAQGHGGGSLAIAPKEVRDLVDTKKREEVAAANRRQIAQQSAYIEQLERSLEVGR